MGLAPRPAYSIDPAMLGLIDPMSPYGANPWGLKPPTIGQPVFPPKTVAPSPNPQPVVDPMSILQGTLKMPAPVLRPPAPMPGPAPVDFGALRSRAQQVYAPLPAPQPLAPPPTRPTPKTFDMQPFVEEAKKLKPKNDMESDAEFKNSKFYDALAAAALASTQSDDIGEVIALAGGAFLGASRDADRDRKAESRAYEDELRGFEMQMMNMKMQSAQLGIEAENTASEVEYMNLLDQKNAIDTEIMRGEEVLMQNRQLGAQLFGTEVDIAGQEAEYKDRAAFTAYQNEQSSRDWANAQAQRVAGVPEISADGLSYNHTYIDKDGQQVTKTNIPLGEMGKFQQIATVAAMIGGTQGEGMMEDASNAIFAQMSPELYEKRVLSQILLHPNAPKLFEQKMWFGKDSDRPIDMIGKALAPTTYDYVVKKAFEAVDKAITEGRIPAEKREEYLKEMVVNGMMPYMNTSVWNNIKGWEDPKINGMLKLMGTVK